MRNIALLFIILLTTSSCEQYKHRKQTMAEYYTIFSKVQELEKTINTTNFKTLSGEELSTIHEIGG